MRLFLGFSFRGILRLLLFFLLTLICWLVFLLLLCLLLLKFWIRLSLFVLFLPLRSCSWLLLRVCWLCRLLWNGGRHRHLSCWERLLILWNNLVHLIVGMYVVVRYRGRLKDRHVCDWNIMLSWISRNWSWDDMVGWVEEHLIALLLVKTPSIPLLRLPA